MLATWHLTGLLVSLIASYVGNALLFRMTVFHIGNYPIVITILITVFYLIPLAPLTFCVFRRTTLEATTPYYVFVLYALFDTLSAFLAVVGATSISGPVQLLIGKLDIVCVMAGSYVLAKRGILKTHFQWTHYVGAGLIFAGVLTVVVPKLANGGDEYNSIAGIIVYASSNIPYTVSMLYKEKTTKLYQISALYSNTMTSVWQFVFSFLMLPAMMIPAFGGTPPSRLFPNMWEGLKCVFAAQHSLRGDECNWAQCLLIGYVCINVIANMLMISAVRVGSGSVVMIAGAVVLPVANLLFTRRWLMGQHVTHMTWADLFALLLILAGFIVYKLRPDQAADYTDPIPDIGLHEYKVEVVDAK